MALWLTDHLTNIVGFAYWGFVNLVESLMSHTPNEEPWCWVFWHRQTDVRWGRLLSVTNIWDPTQTLRSHTLLESQMVSNPVVHLGPLLPPKLGSRALQPALPALRTMSQTPLQSPCGPAYTLKWPSCAYFLKTFQVSRKYMLLSQPSLFLCFHIGLSSRLYFKSRMHPWRTSHFKNALTYTSLHRISLPPPGTLILKAVFFMPKDES